MNLYLVEWRRYSDKTVPLLKKEGVLFLVSGFFSGAVAQTGFGPWLADLLLDAFGSFQMGILFFISLSIIGLSLMGFHPIVIITVYVTSINPVQLGFTPLFYSILLLGSWGIATSLSPMTAVSHLLSNLLHEKVWNISFRWNLVYVFLLMVILVLYLEGLDYLGFIH